MRKLFGGWNQDKHKRRYRVPPNPAKGAEIRGQTKGTQVYHEDAIQDSVTYSEFLRGIQQGELPKKDRDKFYAVFSKEYNIALMNGWYESAVVYLMLFRMIRKQEEAPKDMVVLAKCAMYIIQNTMAIDWQS